MCFPRVGFVTLPREQKGLGRNMCASRLLFLLIIAVANVGVAGAKDDSKASNYYLIQHTVNEFITGIREGDADRLRAVSNFEHGHAIWPRTKDDARSVISVTFGKLAEGLQPYEGYGLPHKIVSINIIGEELAVANIAANAPQSDGDGAILEFFTLAKVNGEWQIISLQWISRPGLVVSG